MTPSTTTAVLLFPDTYLDSVVQLSGTRAMREVSGVGWAAVAMATESNLATLRAEGFDPAEWDGAGPGDLVLAVRAETGAACEAAQEAGRAAAFAPRTAGGTDHGGGAEPDPRSLAEAVARQAASTVAVISVAGEYAALETHQALGAGLDVLLFSDNVSLDDEIELKTRAAALDRLVMGPGAGTAMLGRTCLGFANVVAPAAERTGAVGVVAAAGTGAQEVASLLDRYGVGVTHVIGLGGRDLGADVGGLMGRLAVRTLAADPATDAILLVSKPPDPDVARAVVAEAGDTPLVAAVIGMDESLGAAATVVQVPTLEAGALATLRVLGRAAPDPAAGLRARVEEALTTIGPDRTLVRGLYSGGTLCYESLVVLARVLGPVWSNTPLEGDLAVPAPPGSHVCLDLGEEEYTRGRPHPMIDPEARLEHLREQGREPGVAAIVLDVVLGHGAHPDPADALAGECARITTGGGPCVVVHVLGTDGDPQGLDAQRRAFRDAGCVVTGTGARAALAAAAIARRDPGLVEITELPARPAEPAR